MKLLNIQLKIQLNYSHNFAQMQVGKITIIEMNGANRHMGMKETSQHRTPLGCGTGRLCLWLKENRAGLAASHEKEQPEPVLPTAGHTADERGVMHIAPYCFGATSLTQALQNGVFLPRLTRRSYSFLSDHQQSQKQANS